MDASILGKDINSGQLVTLEQEQRLRGLYVIGKTGSGKTTLLVNMILQDIEQGMGVCLIEPHGDSIVEIVKRLPAGREQDVILLDPLDDYAFGLNLYHCDNPLDDKQVSRTVNYVMEVFAKLFTDGDITFAHFPNMAQVLRNTAYTLIANPGMTMAEIPLLLHDDNARARLITQVRNPQVLLFWQRYERKKTQEQE